MASNDGERKRSPWEQSEIATDHGFHLWSEQQAEAERAVVREQMSRLARVERHLQDILELLRERLADDEW